MNLKNKLWKRITATVMSVATIIIGVGAIAGSPEIAYSDTVNVAEAYESNCIFSPSATIQDILDPQKEFPEFAVKNVQSVIESFPQYDSYSAIYTSDLDTNLIMIYNPDHMLLRAALDTDNGIQWTQNLVTFQELLSSMTGITPDKIIYIFDTANSFSPTAYSGNKIRFDNGSSLSALTGILQNKVNTNTILHETSHLYHHSIYSKMLFDSDDDVFTNFRAICALHLMGLEKESYYMISGSEYRPVNICSDYLPNSNSDNPLMKNFANKLFSDVSIPQFLSQYGYDDNDPSRNLNYFLRLSMLFAPLTNNTESNNILNPLAIETNWDNITEEMWKKLIVLCVSDVNRIRDITYQHNDEIITIPAQETKGTYYNYISKCTQKLDYYYYNNNTLCTESVRITPTVKEWFNRKPLDSNNGINTCGNLIQALNAIDYLTKQFDIQIETKKIENKRYENKDVLDFYFDRIPHNYVKQNGYTLTGPDIINQPIDACVSNGKKATFNFDVSGDNLVYQWEYNKGNGWKKSQAGGANSASVTVPATEKNNGVKYRCIVFQTNSNSIKDVIAVSNEAFLKKEIDKVTLSKNEFPYTGKAIFVDNYLQVFSGSTYPKNETDFTMSYSNNTKCGYNTAEVTITGIENFSGQITKKYSILPAKQPAPKLSTEEGGLGVSWKLDDNAQFYQIDYCQNSSFEGPTLHHKYCAKEEKSCILKRYTEIGETWYVRVRSAVSSDGTKTGIKAGIWSDTKSITLGRINRVNMRKAEYSYTGNEVKVVNSLSVYSGDIALKYNTDFITTYSNNVVPGENTASVTIQGIGEYSGTIIKNYSIILFGDVDGDTCVANADAIRLCQYLAGDNVSINMLNSDVNGDGIINETDLSLIQQYVAGSVHTFPAEIATITKQPKSITSSSGKTVKISLEAKGGGTLTYQWQTRKNANSAWTTSAAQTNTLTFKATPDLSGYQYRCKVTSSNGTWAISNTVTFTCS